MKKLWMLFVVLAVGLSGVSLSTQATAEEKKLTFVEKMEKKKAEKAAKKAAKEKAENAENGKYLDSVESDVIKLDVSKDEIMNRGGDCISRLVQFDAVSYADNSSLLGYGTSNGQNIQGGPVIVSTDKERGILIANSRLDYTNMLIGFNVQSKITLMAKEGRYKLRHSGIKFLQKSTGGSSNNGYGKILKQWGIGWETARDELVNLSNKVSSCMVAKIDDDW